MLDAFIIEEIKRRERTRREELERPVVELPIPRPEDGERSERKGETDPKPSRGVVVIDLYPS
ncbi:MAG: hypothetical protein RL653_3797 [Pseudomonadota bacterium]|jgi:hypothetical protein